MTCKGRKINARNKRGASVIRIHLPYLYAFAEALEGLSQVKAGARLSDLVYSLWTAKQKTEELVHQSVFAASLISSRQAAEALIAALDAQLNNQNNPDRQLQYGEAWYIDSAKQQFKIALLAEMGVFPSFFVTQKGGFDTLTLLERPLYLFPVELPSKVPEAVFDATEVGKAMAFELATACGFHLFRVVESVLRRYYSHLSKGNPTPKVRTIGTYVKKMRQLKCGEEVILSTLEQIASLHRNPLIHPEAILTMEQAISLLGISRSVIGTMLNELPVPDLTTITAAA